MTADGRIARVIDVLGDCQQLVLMVGATSYLLDAPDPCPSAGDLFRVSPTDPPTLLEKIGAAIADAFTPTSDAMRWRNSNAKGQSRFEALWQRHRARRAVRDYLDQESFIEIDTPLLVRGSTPDVNIQSIEAGDRYLVTSAEYQIKRLEVGGFDRVYTLTQNFRGDDGEGRFRNPEFTMLEWARVGEDLAAIERDAEAIGLAAHHALGGRGTVQFGGQRVDLTPPWDRTTVQEAVESATKCPLPDFSLRSLQRVIAAAGIDHQPSWLTDAPTLFSMIMDHIQPSLGVHKPVFLQDWPSFETSSAAEKNDGIVSRSELFIAGVEIADGFPSLTDPHQQAANFAAQTTRRITTGRPPVAIDQAYLNALAAGMPQGAGMALGFDRLIMVMTDRADIRDVLAFAWDEL